MPYQQSFMLRALHQAHLSVLDGETPAGAVIVKDGEVIALGRNRRERAQTALGHAEIEAIGNACKALNSWRLSGCDLYVTLEPCPMCAGAIVNARIDNVYFGAYDCKAGAMGSVVNLATLFPHKPEVLGGFMEDQCRRQIQDFFKVLRLQKEEKITLRRFNNNDDTVPVRLLLTAEGFSLLDPGYTTYELQLNHVFSRGYPMVAVQGSRVVGYANINFQGRMRAIVVDPEFRHKGVGTFLLSALELKAVNAGKRRIYAPPGAEKYRPFLLNHDFIEVEEEGGTVYFYKDLNRAIN